MDFFQLLSSEMSHVDRCTLFCMLLWASSYSSDTVHSNTTVWHPKTWANKKHPLKTWLARGHGVLVLWGRIVSTESLYWCKDINNCVAQKNQILKAEHPSMKWNQKTQFGDFVFYIFHWSHWSQQLFELYFPSNVQKSSFCFGGCFCALT